jgi:hypothetical protein
MVVGLGQGGLEGRDLVVVALPGVQRFIAEARSTADVRAASEIVQALASAAAVECRTAGGELVLPTAPDDDEAPAQTGTALSGLIRDGMPNRVVALAPPREGAKVAKRVTDAVKETWGSWIRQVFDPDKKGEVTGRDDGALVTPGFPVIQWVCVPALPGGYAAQWARAHDLLEARRSVRDFEWVCWRGKKLCTLSPQWPAGPMPPGLREYEEETLATANWVKRQWRRMREQDGFASTSSIASAVYRREVADRIDDPMVRAAVSRLMSAARTVSGQRETPVPGLSALNADPGRWLVRSAGPWVYEDRWQLDPIVREVKGDRAALRSTVASGAAAAGELARLMAEKFQVPGPATYLAVLVQDLDGMGMFLSGVGASANGTHIETDPEAHAEVSRLLQHLAARQRKELEDPQLLGVPVYAGGDDLLAFVPAATALKAARACHDLIPDALPTASTAVLFFHYHAGLRSALAQARGMLEQAKSAVPGKHALSVGYLRRSGVSEVSVQPWAASPAPTLAEYLPDDSAAGLFGLFARDMAYPLSPRLVADLERDAGELRGLWQRDQSVYLAELTRLVRRHMAAPRNGHLLDGSGGEHPSQLTPGHEGLVTHPPRAAAGLVAAALRWLGEHEYAMAGDGRPPGGEPLPAARVGVFLRQEAR